MALTVQRLQRYIGQLAKAALVSGRPVSPIFVVPATQAMESPLQIDERRVYRLDTNQPWGGEHRTSWLTAQLHLSEAEAGLSKVLQLLWDTTPRDPSSPWDTGPKDGLQLQLEATVFLDQIALGGFDSRHSLLVLPDRVCDNHMHTLAIRVYTRREGPFKGLTIHTRDERLWQLYRLMQTLLDVYLTLGEHSLTAHRLLEQLNNTYNQLDLREGWRSKRLTESAYNALNYLQASFQQMSSSHISPHILVSGHAHLDVGWLWPYWRTRQKIEHTISNVLGLMERYPHFYYSQSQPQLMQWLKEDAPDIYARMKERILEGRIEPVGAMWVEADCNLPSGEALIRQIMYGTRFLHQEFGITTRLIWLPDAFGYSAALPQIMRGCKIETFMTTKLSWNQFNRMPYDTFRWRGIDGSEVLAHFITAPDVNENTTYYTYNGPLQPSDMVKTWMNYQQQSLNDRLLYLCGWGDGGGGPAEDQLERVEIMANLPDFPRSSMGRVSEYFTDLYERVWEHPRLPTWVGELYLELHRGTYTSQAAIKRLNRQMELFYREVELLNAWGTLYGMPAREAELHAGWQRILLNQFHDVLPGSSIPEVYDDARKLYEEARSLGESARHEALSVLARSMGVQGEKFWFLNTLPWQRTDPVQLKNTAASTLAGGQRSTDWDGTPMMLLDGLSLPSYGVATMAAAVLEDFDPSDYTCCALWMDGSQIALQNDYYELVLDKHGEISRLYDKRIGREVLALGQTGNQLIAFEDRPLNFDAWDIDLYYEEKPYLLHNVTQIEIIEDGPIRTTVEVTKQFLSSWIKQRISLWRSSPRIDFMSNIDWHEHDILLKAAFPLAINSTRATYEIQFGSVERPTHRNSSWDRARFEVYAHRWVDLSEGGYGVSLLNDGKYGHDIHGHVIRLTLLKSSTRPDPQADQGVHRFTYSLQPHLGDWREAQIVRRAYELNVPVLAIVNSESSLATDESKKHICYSFLNTNCPHIVVETIKPAENEDGLIVRFYEAHNQRGRGDLTFFADILSAEECDLLEERIGPAIYQGNRLSFEVKPFEIKTFRVRVARMIT